MKNDMAAGSRTFNAVAALISRATREEPRATRLRRSR
jgi:hypothetical protein